MYCVLYNTDQCLCKEGQLFDPFIHFGFDGSYMSWTGNGGDVDLAVVQQSLYLISTTKDEHIFGVAVW